MDACLELGVPGVGLWREPVQSYGLDATAKLVRDAGLAVTALCRGGFFTAIDPAERARALDDNRKAVDEAATLGTDTLVLVSGGLPDGSKDLHGARERIADALGELGPYAEERGVRLAIEPLHPMFASDRCVVSTLTQALDLAERFPAQQVGVTVDTYHIWWDDQAPAGIARAGAGGRIHTFQLADWTTPLPEGVLNGRGQIEDGAIDMRSGSRTSRPPDTPAPSRVELFNDGLWARDGREVLAETAARFVEHVLP
ncbi:sugar phosphate isomerase/epimerase family protein [Streptomyces sp. L7]